MRPGRAADHSPPSSAAVMEEYRYTSTHPLGHTGPATGSIYQRYLEEGFKGKLRMFLEKISLGLEEEKELGIQLG